MALGALRFAAFLSYSRKDQRLARWLVRSLEDFQPPRSTLAELEARTSPFLAARPVFRDVHDMPVGGDISGRLLEILDASASMVVLCTPSAAASAWVNREVQGFARRHPARPIIPAVAEGDPDDDASYPPALLALGKPLAADLREPGERRQGVVKIAAAILGLDVDRLVGRVARRDAERRRWLVAGSGAAGAVVVGLGLTAGAMATRARASDDLARANVEKLLTDTRREMDAVGLLAAKAAVHDAAEVYFDRKAGRRLNRQDLLLKAEWLRQEGIDAGKRQEHEQSLAYRQRAYAATSELLERNPDDPESLFSHSQSAFWLTDHHLRQGATGTAQTFARTYRTTAEHLLAVAPDYSNATHQTDARSEVYYARVNLGVLALEENRDPRAAATAFLDALGVLDAKATGLGARLNLSRSHLQYVDALAQYADADEVFAAVKSWEPLLNELEASRGQSDEVDYHLTNSWGLIFKMEEAALPVALQNGQPATSPAAMLRTSGHDPENLESLALSAEVRMLEATPDCSALSRALDVDAASKLQLKLLRECLPALPPQGRLARCSQFADALAAQPPQLDLEQAWSALLSECRRTAGADAQELSASIDAAADRLFFHRKPEEMRLWAQLELACLDGARARVWTQALKASLESRGWTTKGDRRCQT